MPFQPVLLITDALFFLLTAALIGLVLMIRSRPHLRRPWEKVLKRTTGAVSLVVLLCFFSIALIDSLHFRPKLENAGESNHQYSNEILSVLDIAMAPMRIHVEKTFSAPLSTHLFSKEVVIHDDGSTEQIYPRLKYGGAHLEDPDQGVSADITSIVVRGIFVGLIIWMAAWLLIALWRSKVHGCSYFRLLKDISCGGTIYPLRAVAITTGVITLIVVVSMSLGAQYHLFGTDKVGQDVFYQSIKSIRTGILIGSLTTLVMLPVAITLGAMAGFFRGWVDDVIQYIYTTLNSIPNVLLIAASVLLIQVYMSNNADSFDSLTERADLRLLFLCLILGITSWTGLCRLLRAETFKLREMEYIQSATAFGVTKLTCHF